MNPQLCLSLLPLVPLSGLPVSGQNRWPKLGWITVFRMPSLSCLFGATLLRPFFCHFFALFWQPCDRRFHYLLKPARVRARPRFRRVVGLTENDWHELRSVTDPLGLALTLFLISTSFGPFLAERRSVLFLFLHNCTCRVRALPIRLGKAPRKFTSLTTVPSDTRSRAMLNFALARPSPLVVVSISSSPSSSRNHGHQLALSAGLTFLLRNGSHFWTPNLHTPELLPQSSL